VVVCVCVLILHLLMVKATGLVVSAAKKLQGVLSENLSFMQTLASNSVFAF